MKRLVKKNHRARRRTYATRISVREVCGSPVVCVSVLARRRVGSKKKKEEYESAGRLRNATSGGYLRRRSHRR